MCECKSKCCEAKKVIKEQEAEIRRLSKANKRLRKMMVSLALRVWE
jgi:hypothetical protein